MILFPTLFLRNSKNISADPNPNSVLHQYTRGFGHPRLIQALSKLYGRLLNHPVDPLKEVLVTDGAYEALFTSIMGHINPGDEVIIIEPYFDCYEPKVKLAGGTPVFISLAPTKKDGHITSADWKLNPEELSAAFTPKTKAIIFNNPNNPLGKVYKRDEIQMIADLCIKHNVLCISDDVYEHMVFDDNEMIRMATLPGMWERTITIGSAGKTFSVTGWKLGWALGPEHLIRNCQIPREGDGAKLIAQNATSSQFRRIFKPKRDYIARVLKDIGMNPVIPEGGYFILADWSSFADKVDLMRIIKHIGESYIRLCFIKHNDSLQKAEEILKAWKKELD
ncbi:CCBL [Lepeophtheirus salmonis]|uniref:CCBL n=1 Tax=Lepeophtheirus salmonis TaxID=72036 RepID=A0A7R8CG60_LEPSM|nr:CCBL [Lepeophtheirus salmonis]CAF2766226.1 CCBL [Lepeophtheirus salmonis]